MIESVPAPGEAVPSLEIHVPISPTPLFFNRVHYLAASLRVHGGELADAPIVVTVGDDSEPFDVAAALAWARRYPIEWRWLPREIYARYVYWGTRLHRFSYRFNADVVLILDPDVLVLRPFTDLVREVARRDVFCGTPAHVSPVRGDFTWERLFEAAGAGDVPYSCEHSGWGIDFTDERRRYCPPYFNLGVLFGTARLVSRIGETIFDELATVWTIEDFFRAQMSLTLALVRSGVPWDTIPVRYNFANDPRWASAYGRELLDVRLMHYLRKDQFDKDAHFETPEQVASLLARDDAHEVNRAFFERLRPVHERVLDDLRR